MHPLEVYREIQNVHGPNWCFFASKFFAGKLIGLFDQKKHTQDFVNSKWYRSHKTKSAVFDSWAKPFQNNRQYFNTQVIRPAVQLSEAGIAKAVPTKLAVEFEMTHNVTLAESLLRSNVPVVAAVDLQHANTGGWGGQDHYGVLIRGSQSELWFVDPWGPAGRGSIAKLSTTTLRKPATIRLNAGVTTIPCRRAFFGYYREVSGTGIRRTL